MAHWIGVGIIAIGIIVVPCYLAGKLTEFIYGYKYIDPFVHKDRTPFERYLEWREKRS